VSEERKDLLEEQKQSGETGEVKTEGTQAEQPSVSEPAAAEGKAGVGSQTKEPVTPSVNGGEQVKESDTASAKADDGAQAKAAETSSDKPSDASPQASGSEAAPTKQAESKSDDAEASGQTAQPAAASGEKAVPKAPRLTPEERAARRAAAAAAKAAKSGEGGSAGGEDGAGKAGSEAAEAAPEQPKEPSPKQPLLDKITALIREHVGMDAVEEAYINEADLHLPVVVVKNDRWFRTAALLKDQLKLTFLACLSGVDYEKYMEVVYHLESLETGDQYCIKVRTDREAPSVPSVTPVWSTANWQEREVYDLLGIDFPGHHDLRRILLPDDWVGHPLRKDYVPLDPEV